MLNLQLWARASAPSDWLTPIESDITSHPLRVAWIKSIEFKSHTMPICIECRYPVSTLYTTYSKADDKALGKGVRLTQCPRCKRFADKYVEHDFVVLFIDLVLIKPQVCFLLRYKIICPLSSQPEPYLSPRIA